MENTIKAIRNEIVELRGATVKIFGQSQVLKSEVEALEIDIIDVLENLESSEVETIEISVMCSDCDGEGCEECDFEGSVYTDMEATKAIEELYDRGDLKEIKCNNSYNWGSPVTNDFDFKIYQNLQTDTYYVEFKVHRYGDVRSNYTESVILEFNDDNKFYELLLESNKIIEVDGFDCYISIFSDIVEVSHENGEHITDICACDMDELIEELKNLN
ncbi:MAG: hypothetical protein ACRDDY_04775 [Clostridium sp.]|uniref:hypothetical protein n=1 Tax=Clostridium sp. TaxID=1506 RepID=UPI003EE6FCEB